MKKKFPDFKGMSKVIAERGVKDKKTLVIMPFHNKYDFLEKHLDLLVSQTAQNFDLLIVGSSGSDEKIIWEKVSAKNPDFAVTLCKRFEDNGAAGGFYTGERFGLENGYENMILAEEDALPIDKNLISALLGVPKAEVVAPICSFMIGETVVFKASGPHFYTLVRRDALLRVGLHFIPIYLGAEDVEMSGRLPKAVQVQAAVTHPAWLSVFTNFERNTGYRVNNTIFTCRKDLLNYIYTYLVYLPSYFVFGTSVAKKASAHIFSSVLKMRYGKEAVFKGGKMDIVSKQDYYGTVVPVALPEAGSKQFILESMVKQFIPLAVFSFRKKVRFYPVKNYALAVGMLLSKETWVATSGGDYLLAENRNPVFHILKLAGFLVLAPLMLLAGILIWPSLVLRMPKTKGLGISDLAGKS